MSLSEKYIVKPIPRYQIKEWLLKKHYAKRVPTVTQMAFGLFTKDKGEMVGCCTYALPASDHTLQMCGKEHKSIAKELSRLIKNDGLEKNLQTWFVAQTFKLLPKPMIIVSYSDSNFGHYGYTYQALNFLYTGEGGSAFEYVFQGKSFHNRWIQKKWFDFRNLPYDEELSVNENFKKVGGEIIKQKPKHRYVIFLGNKKDKKMLRKKLKWDVLPYPKGENQRYDTSYKTSTQLGLF